MSVASKVVVPVMYIPDPEEPAINSAPFTTTLVSIAYAPYSPPESTAPPVSNISPPYCSIAELNPEISVPSSVTSSLVPATLNPTEVNPPEVPFSTIITPMIVGSLAS